MSEMRSTGNLPLITAGISTAIASLLHIAIIFGGGDWYRFFGAGEEMATMAEQGSMIPSIITFAIAAVLMLWSGYAFSGGGALPKIPLRRTALTLISAIFLLRGLILLPMLFMQPEQVGSFWIISSFICLAIGACYTIGTRQVWEQLTHG